MRNSTNGYSLQMATWYSTSQAISTAKENTTIVLSEMQGLRKDMKNMGGEVKKMKGDIKEDIKGMSTKLDSLSEIVRLLEQISNE